MVAGVSAGCAQRLPFSIQDDTGPPGRRHQLRRLPVFFEANVHLERKLSLRRHFRAFRMGCNDITGRRNPNVVNADTSSPNFLQYYGGQGRTLNFRIRWLGRVERSRARRFGASFAARLLFSAQRIALLCRLQTDIQDTRRRLPWWRGDGHRYPQETGFLSGPGFSTEVSPSGPLSSARTPLGWDGFLWKDRCHDSARVCPIYCGTAPARRGGNRRPSWKQGVRFRVSTDLESLSSIGQSR